MTSICSRLFSGVRNAVLHPVEFTKNHPGKVVGAIGALTAMAFSSDISSCVNPQPVCDKNFFGYDVNCATPETLCTTVFSCGKTIFAVGLVGLALLRKSRGAAAAHEPNDGGVGAKLGTAVGNLQQDVVADLKNDPNWNHISGPSITHAIFRAANPVVYGEKDPQVQIALLNDLVQHPTFLRLPLKIRQAALENAKRSAESLGVDLSVIARLEELLQVQQ